MNGYRHRFPQYGTIGLVILLLMETAVFSAQTDALPNWPWWLITSCATPVCWWAYILIVDAGIYRRRGTSLLTDRRESFVVQCILSVAFWCLFEAYNRTEPPVSLADFLTALASLAARKILIHTGYS